MKNYSEFHDGFFDGLLLDDSATHIFVSTPQKKRFVIRAQNVASLTAGEFMRPHRPLFVAVLLGCWLLGLCFVAPAFARSVTEVDVPAVIEQVWQFCYRSIRATERS